MPVGSPWTSPKAAGFTVCRSSGGRAYGTNGPKNAYDDSYAYLSGFAENQECEAVIYRSGSLPNVTHEVELHVRMSDSSVTNVVKSYECLFSAEGSMQLMKWNGRQDQTFFSEIASRTLNSPPANGDKVRLRATTSGGVVTLSVYHTPVGQSERLIVSAVDSGNIDGTPPLTSGQPGMAFFNRPGAQNANYGFTSFTARNV